MHKVDPPPWQCCTEDWWYEGYGSSMWLVLSPSKTFAATISDTELGNDKQRCHWVYWPSDPFLCLRSWSLLKNVQSYAFLKSAHDGMLILTAVHQSLAVCSETDDKWIFSLSATKPRKIYFYWDPIWRKVGWIIRLGSCSWFLSGAVTGASTGVKVSEGVVVGYAAAP